MTYENIEMIVAIVYIICGIFWCVNIFYIFKCRRMSFEQFLRICGIFLFPLGAFLGTFKPNKY